jgi:hypothetical protein
MPGPVVLSSELGKHSLAWWGDQSNAHTFAEQGRGPSGLWRALHAGEEALQVGLLLHLALDRPWARAVHEDGGIARAEIEVRRCGWPSHGACRQAMAPAGIVVPAAAGIEHEREGLAVGGKGGEALVGTKAP